MKKLFTRLYIIGFMILTVFFIITIWKVTFAHIVEEYHNRKEILAISMIKEGQKKEKEKTTFEKIILEGEQRVKHYLGYRILEEQRIEGHFHHIDFDIGPDKRSYCIECHGDMPHDDVKELRAFMNMHAFFINCMTCHIKPEENHKSGVFKWYDRTTGEIVESPVDKAKPGTYKAKIIPFEYENGNLVRIDSQERIEFAREYKKKEKTLSEAQRSRAKKLIHNIVSKQPHICEDCHQKESPLLPFEELGYSKKRIDSVTSTEVVGMIKKYTEFYMPRMLQPGELLKKQEK
jgi:hypothetical protein